jgi:hypothetical protein
MANCFRILEGLKASMRLDDVIHRLLTMLQILVVASLIVQLPKTCAVGALGTILSGTAVLGILAAVNILEILLSPRYLPE